MKTRHGLCLAGIAAVVFLAVSCQRESLPGASAEETPVTLRILLPVVTGTKSYVSGTETAVSSMQLVCFDASGLYLGIRNATVQSASAPDGNGKHTGTIIGTAPNGTAKVHFVANHALPVPLPFSAGTSEQIVMHSEIMSSTYADPVCFWGFHSESDDETMKTWLSPDSTPNTLHLIRDRARVRLELSSDLQTAYNSSAKKIEWLIHNGNSRGYIAPYGNTTGASPQPVWGNTSYFATVDSHDMAAQDLPLTAYTDAGRYTLWESPSKNEDSRFDAWDQYQYLFDDANTNSSEGDGRLKVILKVTDPALPSSAYPNGVKYLVALIKNNEEKQLTIIRNYSYVVTCEKVSVDGYPTLEDAINGTQFANAVLEVDRTVTEIDGDEGKLEITYQEDGVTTSKAARTTTGPFDVTFHFTPSVAGTVASSDFSVSWENETYSWPLGSITALGSNNFSFSVNVQSIPSESNDIWDDYVVIRHKSGLVRYLHVFAFKEFEVANPTFEKVNGTTFTEGGTAYPVYKLSFTIPKNYPDEMYPVNIKFATSTLDAYSDATASARSGVYGVSVESTAHLTGGGARQWNEKATTWGYQYLYSIATPLLNADLTEHVDQPVSFYFKDIRGKMAEENRPVNVGLYLTIPYGEIKFYYAD